MTTRTVYSWLFLNWEIIANVKFCVPWLFLYIFSSGTFGQWSGHIIMQVMRVTLLANYSERESRELDLRRRKMFRIFCVFLRHRWYFWILLGNEVNLGWFCAVGYFAEWDSQIGSPAKICSKCESLNKNRKTSRNIASEF